MGLVFTKQGFADLAEIEAKKQLVWSMTSEAEKYTRPFGPWFGTEQISWCAAFVTWCLKNSGINIGVQPFPAVPGFEPYTWALVETYQRWAQVHGCYHQNTPNGYKPQRGDIVLFDWTQTYVGEPDQRWQDHIGVHLGMSPVTTGWYMCAEGNTGNQTNIKQRPPVCVEGWVSLPDGLRNM